MQARLELSLRNGTEYVILADADKLRKLKVSLSARMKSEQSEVVDINGGQYERGVLRPVEVSIMTDQLAGLQLTLLKDTGNTAASNERRRSSPESLVEKGKEELQT